MATATAYMPVNMDSAFIWFGDATVANSSFIRIVNGGQVQEYYGFGFTFDVDTITGGTLTGTTAFVNGSTFYTVTNLNHDAVTVSNFLDALNAAGLLSYIFNGSDTLNGSAANDVINGYAGNDSLLGNGGNDALRGGDGNDVLNGGLGNDTMEGGTGNDIYIRNAAGDVVTEGVGQGNDLVYSAVSCVLGPNLERLTLTGAGNVNGTGNVLNNALTGNTGSNVLKGEAGNDTLNGGAGNDTMNGGAGDDTYVRNAVGDVVTELAGQGNDLVQSAVTYTLGANLERLTLTGTGNINGTGNTQNNALTGNAGNNVLNGAGGADILRGMDGQDTLIWNAQDTLFDGGAGEDTLRVPSGNLNLTTIASTKIQNVERIDLTGGGNNVLTLDTRDVLDLSTTTNTLKVLGDAGDSINIVPGFTNQGIVDGFRSYTFGSATLLVDLDITNVA